MYLSQFVPISYLPMYLSQGLEVVIWKNVLRWILRAHLDTLGKCAMFD